MRKKLNLEEREKYKKNLSIIDVVEAELQSELAKLRRRQAARREEIKEAHRRNLILLTGVQEGVVFEITDGKHKGHTAKIVNHVDRFGVMHWQYQLVVGSHGQTRTAKDVLLPSQEYKVLSEAPA